MRLLRTNRYDKAAYGRISKAPLDMDCSSSHSSSLIKTNFTALRHSKKNAPLVSLINVSVSLASGSAYGFSMESMPNQGGTHSPASPFRKVPRKNTEVTDSIPVRVFY